MNKTIFKEAIKSDLTIRIIPCLDVRDGRVVKGKRFIELRDMGDPLMLAKHYNDEGADELCYLDITASHENRQPLFHIIKETARLLHLPFSVGGGIKSLEDIRNMLMAGADKICINSAAISDPELIKKASIRFGRQCIVVAMDVKFEQGKYYVFSHGGRHNSGKEALSWARDVEKLGAGEILLTSMDRDGMKAGFDTSLLLKFKENLSIPIISSGGAGSIQHIIDAINLGGADAVLAASIFHEKSIRIKDIHSELKANKIKARIVS